MNVTHVITVNGTVVRDQNGKPLIVTSAREALVIIKKLGGTQQGFWFRKL